MKIKKVAKTITTENQIKRLTTSKANLYREISSLQEQQNSINNDISSKRKKISEIDKELLQTTKGFTISEHAILRMLERAYEQGDMIAKVKKQMEDEIKPKLEAIGVVNCEINLACGLTAVIKNNLVVTVKQS